MDLPVKEGLKMTLYRVSQEEWAKFREGVPYVKILSVLEINTQLL
jgi:hypothetical protein